VLDVNDDEARALLLSIDPLAALAENSEANCTDRLLELTPTDSLELQAVWQSPPTPRWRTRRGAGSTVARAMAGADHLPRRAAPGRAAQRLPERGTSCKALLS